MKFLVLGFVLSFTAAGFATAFAAGASNEIAKNLLLVQSCKQINSQLSHHRNHVNPDPGKSFFKKAYVRSHEKYKTDRAQVKGSASVQALIKLSILNASQADSLIDACIQKAVSNLEAPQAFRSYSSSETLNLVKLEQHNAYVLNLQAKKSQITLDLEKHLANALEAKRFNVYVGESTYLSTNVGKVLASNFNEWGLIFNDEWSSSKIKVIGKKHYKRFFVKLSQGLDIELNEADFSAALTAFRQSFGERVIHQRILGHDRFQALSTTLTKADVVSRIPMVRYYVKVKIKNTSFSFDFDQQMSNILTTNEIEVEIPKSTYDNKSSVFDASANFGTLLLKNRFDVMSGRITKKFISPDPNWMEVRFANGQTYFLSKPFSDQLK